MRTTAEILREEGQAKGVVLGRQEGELKNAQETLIDVANDLFAPLPNSLQAKIKSIQSIENLRAITRKAYKTSSLEEFTELVNRAIEN